MFNIHLEIIPGRDSLGWDNHGQPGNQVNTKILRSHRKSVWVFPNIMGKMREYNSCQ